MNIAYANPVYTKFTSPSSAKRVDGVFNGRITSIRRPADKVLFICEDEKTLFNGSFLAEPTKWSDPTKVMNLVSARHDNSKKKATSGFANQGNLIAEGHDDARGNVGFCDGHAEVYGRKDALRAIHSGNPNPDPAGF